MRPAKAMVRRLGMQGLVLAGRYTGGAAAKYGHKTLIRRRNPVCERVCRQVRRKTAQGHGA